MTDDRYMELEMSRDGRLTNEELSQGWHFCYDWDGMLVGPGMEAYETCCTCGVGPKKGQMPINEAGKKGQ